MSPQEGVSNDTPNPIEAKLDTLSQQVSTLSELVASLNDPTVKFTLTAEEHWRNAGASAQRPCAASECSDA